MVCEMFVSVLHSVGKQKEDDSSILFSILDTNYLQKFMSGKVEPSQFFKDVICAYNEATSRQERILAISLLMAFKFSYLVSFNTQNAFSVCFVPPLTKELYYDAKKAFLERGGIGLTKPNEKKIYRQRYDKDMLRLLFEFLNSPSLVQPVAYGTINRKNSEGEKLTMAKIGKLICIWVFEKIYMILFVCIDVSKTSSRCLKITEKVSFNIASEASYVYILSGQKLIKNAKKWSILASFCKPKA